ncbi:MAG: hypothetical protein VX777_06200 [Chlamydiota bacterium]|nr:hypothetical protein [Chlamydiota bacterium]
MSIGTGALDLTLPLGDVHSFKEDPPLRDRGDASNKKKRRSVTQVFTQKVANILSPRGKKGEEPDQQMSVLNQEETDDYSLVSFNLDDLVNQSSSGASKNKKKQK